MISRAERQRIVEDFAQRHGGAYNPAMFLQEVKKTGKKHPAWDWFEWSDDNAAEQYRIWQARIFVRDLKIVFSVQTVGRSGTMKIVHTEAPLTISPMAGRQSGGGYIMTDLNDPTHIAAFCEEAAVSLRSWLRRYAAALPLAHATDTPIERVVAKLEEVAGIGEDAEAAE